MLKNDKPAELYILPLRAATYIEPGSKLGRNCAIATPSTPPHIPNFPPTWLEQTEYMYTFNPTNSIASHSNFKQINPSSILFAFRPGKIGPRNPIARRLSPELIVLYLNMAHFPRSSTN